MDDGWLDGLKIRVKMDDNKEAENEKSKNEDNEKLSRQNLPQEKQIPRKT